MNSVQSEKSGIKKGFTLAEVLLTIVVIGIVAAQTIPALITKVKSIETATGVKKAQAELQQAYISFVNDGTIMDDVWAGNNAHTNALNKLCTKLNCLKNCGFGRGCFPETDYMTLSGYPSGNINDAASAGALGAAILADGSLLGIYDSLQACVQNWSNGVGVTSPLYYSCGYIYIDINGFKGPNQWGRDLFVFWITRTGIFPWGSNDDGYASNCNVSDWGSGCASKILTDGAVNY